MKELKQTELESLWLELKNEQSIDARDKLILHYSPLVKYVAGRVSANLPQSIESGDLVSYGIFGLIDAIEKFDLSRNIKFETYAMSRVKGAIIDELRSLDWVPRSVRQKSREVEDAVRGLEASLGRAATDEEIAGAMHMEIKDFHQLMLKISGTSILSLNEVWYTGEDNDKISIVESIESPSSLNPDTIVEKEEIKRVIIEAIHELPEKEKKVLILYYYEDLTLKEIGEVLAVTESRISQLHTKAIMRLRSRLSHVKKGIL